MERKSVGFEQLSDIFGFRVIVKTLPECYRALGIVHTTWPVVPGRFKDYVSTPKQNDYRSIHTTVIGPGKQRVELQIRTEEMHEIAEYGIAAHALYKDGVGSPTEMLSRESNAYGWLRRTIELLAEGSNPEEFLEHTKLELFHDQVFCFTPKGKLIALPRKATPIDFAYAVHTDVGNRAVGCKINGKIAPLVSELDQRRRGRDPHLEVADGAAGGLGIDRGHRQGAARDPPGDPQRGARAIRRAGPAASSSGCASAPSANIPTKSSRGALPRLARASIDDVFAAVGRGEMRPSDVARAMYPDYKEERIAAVPPPKSESGWFGLKKGKARDVQGAGRGGAAAGADPDPRHQLRPAGALRAERRRGAGRPHRRHPDAGRGDHDLSDPVADAEGFRGHAGALARRALGHATSARRSAFRRGSRCSR